MKTETIFFWGKMELTFDEESPEFKESLKDYQEMTGETEIKDMLKHVTDHVIKFGTDAMVEGVGYVGFNGRKPKEMPFSGIMVGEDYDELEYPN